MDVVDVYPSIPLIKDLRVGKHLVLNLGFNRALAQDAESADSFLKFKFAIFVGIENLQ